MLSYYTQFVGKKIKLIHLDNSDGSHDDNPSYAGKICTVNSVYDFMGDIMFNVEGIGLSSIIANKDKWEVVD